MHVTVFKRTRCAIFREAVVTAGFEQGMAKVCLVVIDGWGISEEEKG